MKLLLYTLAALVLSGVVVRADAQGRGHRTRGAADASAVAARADVRVVFSDDDVRLIRAHFAPRYRQLPPGLQKKLVRTGQLPPGWEKKMEPFPVALERRLAILPDGYRRGVIDGHAVIYRPGSSVVIDATVLF